MQTPQTPDDAFRRILEDVTGRTSSDRQAYALRMVAELEIPYDSLVRIAEVDRDTCDKIQREVEKLLGTAPTLGRVRKIDLALSGKERAVFCECSAGFFKTHPQHASYGDLLVGNRDDFVRLFTGRPCVDPVFRRYQRDRAILGEYFAFLESILRGEPPTGAGPRGERHHAGPMPKEDGIPQHSACCAAAAPHRPDSNDTACTASGPGEQLSQEDFLAAYAALIQDIQLTEVQKQSLDCVIHNEENMLLSAPTSSGKTLVAIVGILKCLQMRRRGRAYYIAPIKALIKEKALEIGGWINRRAATPTRAGYKITALSSDSSADNHDARQADVCVGTPEKLDILLRSGHAFDLIVIDEVHLLYYKRGDVIEAIVARVGCRVIALSATIPDIEGVRAFLRAPAHNCLHFGEDYRPTRLRYEHHPVEINAGSQSCVVRRALGEAKPLLLFVNERQTTQDVAGQIVGLLCNTDHHIGSFCHSDLARTGSGLPNDRRAAVRTVFSDSNVISLVDQIRDFSLFRLISHGVGIHHAGLNRRDRHLIESLFRLGVVSILVSTTTLSWGINLPCNTVIVYGTFPQLEVIQMCGRAGRSAQQGDAGGSHCVACYYGPIAHGPDDEGLFLESVAFHLNAEICMGSVECLTTGFAWLRRTFYYQKVRQRIGKEILEQHGTDEDAVICAAGMGEAAADALVARHVRMTVYRAAHELEQGGLLTNFRPTLLGRLSYKFYLRPMEAQALQSINMLFDESLFLELLGCALFEAPRIILPDIQVPYPTHSAISRLIQFVLGGYSAPLDVCGFLQNILRLLSAMFEYALAKELASACHALRLYHRIAARLDAVRASEANPSDSRKPEPETASEQAHFCRLSCNDHRTLLYFSTERGHFEDIQIDADARRRSCLVHISIRIRTAECISSSKLLLLVTDSADHRILHARGLSDNASHRLEVYLEDRMNGFFNICILSRHYPAVFRTCVAVMDAPPQALQMPDAVHDVLWEGEDAGRRYDYLVVLDDDSTDLPEGAVAYGELNYIIYSCCSLVASTCAVGNYSTGLQIVLENAAPVHSTDVDKDALCRRLRILHMLQEGRLRLLLTQWHRADEFYIIRSVILGCVERGIEFACTGMDFGRLLRVSRFFVLDKSFDGSPNGHPVDTLFANLTKQAVDGPQIVLFDSSAAANKYCGLYNAYLDANFGTSAPPRAVYREHLPTQAHVVFSSCLHITVKHSSVHIVSEAVSYSRALELSQLCSRLYLYTDKYEYRNIRIRAEHDARMHKAAAVLGASTAPFSDAEQIPGHICDPGRIDRVTSGQLIHAGSLQPLPPEMEYYLGNKELEYSNFGAVLRKYALSIHVLRELVSGLKDGVGLKTIFRLVLGVLRNENLLAGSTIEDCVGLIMDAGPLACHGASVESGPARVDESHNVPADGAAIRAVPENGAAGILGSQTPLGRALRTHLRCSIELCHLKRQFKALLASIYALQRLDRCGDPFYEVEMLREQDNGTVKGGEGCACKATDGSENRDNQSLLSYLCPKSRNMDGRAVDNVVESKASREGAASHAFMIHVYKMVSEELLFYLVDETFNFEVVQIFQTGCYTITWPQEVYVLCSCGQGSVHIGRGSFSANGKGAGGHSAYTQLL